MNNIPNKLIEIAAGQQPPTSFWPAVEAAKILLPVEVTRMLDVQPGDLDRITAEVLADRIERIRGNSIRWRKPWDGKMLDLLVCPPDERKLALEEAVSGLNLTEKRGAVLQILGGASTIIQNPVAVADQLIGVLHGPTPYGDEVRWHDTDQVIAISLRRRRWGQEPEVVAVELRYPPLIGPRVPTPEEHDRLQWVFPLPQALGEALLRRQS